MTIRFACDCGQELAAADEHAGKRVKCTSCGGIQTVPPTARPRPAVAAPPAVANGSAPFRFNCDCGQTCQARPEHAGKKTKCPGCGKILTIPSPDEPEAVEELDEPRPRKAASITADRPVARSGKRGGLDFDDEEDRPRRRGRDEDEEEDDRPRKRKKGGAKKWLFIGAGVAAVAGIAVLLWLLLSGGTSSDFDLVPRDAQGFVTIRVADLVNTPIGKKMMDKAGDQQKFLKEIEDKAGLSLKDIERVTIVVVDGDKQVMWGIVQTSRAIDKDKFLKLLDNPKESSHAGKTYYVKGDGGVAFLGPKLLVGGPEAGLKKCLEMKKPGSGPLSDALKLASKKKYQIAGGINITGALAEVLKKGGGRGAQQMKDLLDVKSASFGIAAGEGIQLDASAEFSSKDKAKDVATMINSFIAFAKAGGGGDSMKGVTDAKASGKSLEISWKFDKSVMDQADKLGAMMLGPVVQKIRGAAGATQAMNNFKQLALAFHNYHSAMNHFPQAAIYGKNGQPLLSWRVAILPYIEQGALYKEFKLDEPWNSAHNIKLASRMPKIFEIPGASAPANQTYIQVFTGKNTPFTGPAQQVRIPATFTDGTSNTVLLAEAARPVVWTSPADMNVDFVPPKFLVGNHTGRGTLAAMADGSVRTVDPKVSDKTWKAVVSPAGGEILGPDW